MVPKTPMPKWSSKCTWEWSEGGSYWGGGGAFQAVWDEDTNDPAVSYTDGKWHVTNKGALCYDTVWKRSTMTAADGEGSARENCGRHVVAPDGTVWRSDHRDQNGFHAVNMNKIKQGNKVKGTYSKYKRMAGT